MQPQSASGLTACEALRGLVDGQKVPRSISSHIVVLNAAEQLLIEVFSPALHVWGWPQFTPSHFNHVSPAHDRKRCISKANKQTSLKWR